MEDNTAPSQVSEGQDGDVIERGDAIGVPHHDRLPEASDAAEALEPVQAPINPENPSRDDASSNEDEDLGQRPKKISISMQG